MSILARQLYSRLNVLRLQFFFIHFLTIERTQQVFFNCRSLFNEAAYLAALRRLCLPFAIHDANSKQRQKYMKKNHLLLWISAVVGRYGPHLMIVMIFVTQNNFQNGPGISYHVLGFYRSLSLSLSLSLSHSLQTKLTNSWNSFPFSII